MDILTTVADTITEFLSGLSPLETSVFIVGVFFLFLLFIRSDTISKSAPGVLISLGIFFTFLGITIALFNFDTQNITRTIPELLEGLKLAFISSVVGLATSILYRVILLFKPKPPGPKTAEDFYNLMENIRQAVEQGNNNIKEALVGDGEASLSTQITKLRADSQTNFNDLRNEFRDFAERVAQDGTQQLIQALEQVIQDFNQQINEQFGENFQRFNEAVGQLVIWQAEHKEQVERLTEIFTTVQGGIEAANESINNIKESTSTIPEHMEQIRTAFDATNARMQELYAGLETLASIREQAEQTIPAINQYLNQILVQLKEGAERQREAIDNNIAGVEQLQQNVNAQIDNHISRVNEALQNGTAMIIEGVEQLQQKVNTQIADNHRKMTEALEIEAENQREIMKRSVENIQKSQQQVADAMSRQVQVFTEQIENNIAGIEQLQQNVNAQINNHISGVNEALQNGTAMIIEGVEQLQQKVNTQIADNHRKMTEALEIEAENQREIMKRSVENIQKSQQQVADAMSRQVQVFTKQMEKDIGEALKTMGNNLVPITQKLVNDYEQHQRTVSEELSKMKQRIRNRQN